MFPRRKRQNSLEAHKASPEAPIAHASPEQLDELSGLVERIYKDVQEHPDMQLFPGLKTALEPESQVVSIAVEQSVHNRQGLRFSRFENGDWVVEKFIVRPTLEIDGVSGQVMEIVYDYPIKPNGYGFAGECTYPPQDGLSATHKFDVVQSIPPLSEGQCRQYRDEMSQLLAMELHFPESA